MEFINDIKDKTIIIAPSSLKEILLKEKNKMNKLIDIKIMSIKELINKYLFFTDEKAIVYLMNKYNLKYSVAKTYLNNLIYIDNEHELYNLKQELEDKKYLIKDLMFKNNLKNYDVIVYGYDHITRFEHNILNEIKAKIIKKDYNDYKHNIYEFNTIDEEIEFVANEICKLIDSGIDINNIKLSNVQDEYYNIILRIFDNYNIPIELNNDTLYDTNIGLYFLDNLSSDIDETLLLIKENYDFNNEENKVILKQIINILNKYSWCNSYLDIKECLIEEFKNTKLKYHKLKKCIQIIDLKDNYITDENHVFLMSFNQNIIPSLHKDEEYIKDKDKIRLNIETSSELNMIENEVYKNIIQSIKNLTITYKLHSYYEEYHISSLNYVLNYEVIRKNETKAISYSIKNDQINLAKSLDNLIKYGVINDDLAVLYSTYNDIDYLTYNNNYNTIDKDKLREYIKTLRLSYSSINNYYKCSFRYYISNILKLDTYTTTFEAFVGSVFHNVLSKCFVDDFDIDSEYETAIEEELQKLENKSTVFELTEENNFFLGILKEDLVFIINTIKKQYQNMSLNNSLYEKYIEINKEGPIKIVFNGFVDKIITKEENNITYTAIIDYKTGSETIDLKNVEFGLNMQLPVYLYLIKNYKELYNVKVTGFYLQKILNKEQTIIQNKTYEDLKEDSLRLEGYSNSNQDILKLLDKNFASSKTIKGMQIKNDGSFYSTAKVLSDDTMDKLAIYVDKKIDEASKNILDAKFDINPKRIDNKNVSCSFCKFKDICYRQEENFVDLKLSEDLSFLGCDNND